MRTPGITVYTAPVIAVAVHATTPHQIACAKRAEDSILEEKTEQECMVAKFKEFGVAEINIPQKFLERVMLLDSLEQKAARESRCGSSEK